MLRSALGHQLPQLRDVVTAMTTCLVNHTLVGSTTATRSCDAEATHEWHRPARRDGTVPPPIPCCHRAIKPGRDIRELGQ